MSLRMKPFVFSVGFISIYLAILPASSFDFDHAFPFVVSNVLLIFFLFYLFCSVEDTFRPEILFPLIFLIVLTTGTLELQRDVLIEQWFSYSLGIVGFYCGIFLCRVFFNYSGTSKKYEYSLFYVKLFIFTFFVVGFLCTVYVYQKTGIPILSEDVNVVRYNVSANAYISTLGKLIEVAFVLAVLYFFRERKELNRNNLLLLIIIITSILFAVLTGSRNALLKSVLIVLIGYHYYIAQIRPAFLVVTAMCSFFYVGTIGFYRNLSAYGPAILKNFTSDFGDFFTYLNAWWHFVSIQLTVSVDNFSQLLNVVPSIKDFQYGRLLISPFILWLPGEQAKPGVLVKQAIGGEWQGGASVTLLGAFYYDFGFLGVFFGMLMVGVLLKVLHRKAVENDGVIFVLLYSYMLYNSFVSIRSNFTQGFDFVFFPAAFIAFHLFTVRRKCIYRVA